LLFVAFGTVFSATAQPFYPATIWHGGAPNVSGSGNSFMPLLSGDRRYVVFLSTASNLDTNEDLAPYLDVYRHDLVTGQNLLISRGSIPIHGANADSAAASVSSNGQLVAFASRGSDLTSAPDTNDASDIYLSTSAFNPPRLISADIAGNPPPNAIAPRSVPLSDDPRISGDGRWVAFQSFATNLTAEGDHNNETDVFLRDTLNNRTYLISVAVGGVTTANSRSELAAITPDGNYVLMTSTATDLAANAPSNGSREIYLRDVAAGTTMWIRHDDPQPYTSRWPRLSVDARFVLYKLEFPGTNSGPVALYDRQTDSTTIISSNSRPVYPVHMSSDARFVTYDENDQIFLWDRQTGTRTAVSDSATNILSHSAVVSENGSIVAFVSSSNNAPFQIYYKNMVSGQIRRLTENSAGESSGKDHDGSGIVVDPPGEFILFDSAEDQLVADDRNHASDIFLHNISSGQTRLLSRAHVNAPSFTSFGAAGITNQCVSADGNRILFFSSDSTLVPGDTNGWYDAFLHDRRTAQSVALTVDGGGGFSPMVSAQFGMLTPDGRFAFLGILTRSNRFDLAGASGSIVRRDLESGERLVVASNLAPDSIPFSSGIGAFGFSISPDGRWVAYSDSSVVVTDLQTGIRRRGEAISGGPVITHDGRYVFYATAASPRRLIMAEVANLGIAGRTTINGSYFDGLAMNSSGQAVIYRVTTNGSALNMYSIPNRTNTEICGFCNHAGLSADARSAVFEMSSNFSRQVYFKDIQTGTATLVSRNIYGTGSGDADATWPVVSADGRFVAYTSKATNLTTDFPNGWNNLYVYDRLQGSTVRITGSRGNTGYGSGSTSHPVLGPDGRTLVFQSFGSDFVDYDLNDARDVFLLTLGEGDSDNDGMSDSWEQTYFGTNDRDGNGDFDQDGQSDLAEYLAGTNPANGQSFFEVLTITSLGIGQRELIWNSAPGKSYRVEYKPDLQGASWASLGQVIVAHGPTASATDSNATSEKRFYRVVLVQ
ncbi:MAG TPA: hypothetical protein VJ063_15690, partial [Verrucomicrobiae bacterium]|nr:hypothetical protein [Verrucomicrobiae bacterium]